jgi:hypothetical protein
VEGVREKLHSVRARGVVGEWLGPGLGEELLDEDRGLGLGLGLTSSGSHRHVKTHWCTWNYGLLQSVLLI